MSTERLSGSGWLRLGTLAALLAAAACGSSSSSNDAASDAKDAKTGDATAADKGTPDAGVDTATTDVSSTETATDGATDMNADVASDVAQNETSIDTKADATETGTDAAAETGTDVAAMETDTDVSATEAGTDVSATETSADTGGSCVAFANNAPTVQLIKLDQTAPAAAGGTIVDGLYSVISIITYTGPGGATGTTAGAFRQTEQFLNGTWNGVLDTGTATMTFATTYTVAGSGKTILITKTCGNPNPTMLDYTVTGDEVHFLTATAAIVLKKQT